MDIKVLRADWLVDNCEDEFIPRGEEQIEKLKEISKTDKRIIYVDRTFFMIGDLTSEFEITNGAGLAMDLSCWNDQNNCSDWLDIDNLSFKKQDCIDLLEKKLDDEDVDVLRYINKMFSKSEFNDDYDFCLDLINRMLKYVMVEKINQLQRYIIQDDLEINWK